MNLRLKKLVVFQARYELLLMSYNQTIMRQMGKRVVNHEQRNPKEVFDDYRTLLCKAIFRSPKITSPVNVLMHAIGYFSEKVST